VAANRRNADLERSLRSGAILCGKPAAATAFGRKRLQSVRINAVPMLLTKDNRQVNTIFFFKMVL